MIPSPQIVHVSLINALTKGPPPPGNLAVPIYSHGSLVVELYKPVGPIRRNRIRGTRFISSLVGRVCFSTESDVTQLSPVLFCMFRLAWFIDSRTSHPTSSFG